MARPLRVLLDCRMATWTGVGRYTTGLARALARCPEIDLIQVSAVGEEPPVPALASISASKHPFTLAGGLELAGLSRGVDADVTHCTHFPTPVPASHPLVVTLHDLTPLVVDGIMPSVLRRAVYRWWNRRAVEVADHIITDASFTVGEIARVFPAAAGKVTAIPLGVDDFATGPLGELAEPLATVVGSPYLLSMGSTRPHKDLPTLLAAFGSIAENHPRLRLLLVGEGEPGYLASKMAGLPAAVRERVSFTGSVGDSALRALMARAEVFAFPSSYEGYGLPPLEAMALGTPAVVASAASLPEVVGDAALMFDPGDAAGLAERIRALLDDAGLRERTGRAGRARAGELTWERTAEATAAVYRAVAERA